MKFESIPKPHIADYIVIGVFLCICMAIGMFYGYQTNKQKTLENYLFGNRRMLLVPVAMSLFVTFASAISLMGIPAEIYVFGTMYMYTAFGFLISAWIAGVTLVPLIYPLKLTSTYEYLQLRFRSRGVRTLGTLIGMLQTIAYMGVTLYAPALALETVAGLPLWMSIVVLGGIGTFYTSIGGIKSVVWTDVFQFVMLFVGLVAVIIKALILIGGGSVMKEVLEAGHRIQFDDINPDPRVRQTVWGGVFGIIFSWLPSWCNQSSIQRIASLRSLQAAKGAFLLMIPIIIVYNTVLGLLGVIMYTYYNMLKCGPLEAGFVSTMNQVTPYFVFDVLRTLPGLSGVYISCLFSGALSTLSSGINALAANTVEDILPKSIQRSKRISVALIAKLIVVFYGALAVGIAYLLQFVSGSIIQICMAIFGACGGPLAGLFFLGGTFPNANWIGALTGGLFALMVNMWVAVGGQLYSTPPPRLAPNPVYGCFPNDTTTVQSVWTNGTTVLSPTTSNYTLDDVNVLQATSDFPLYHLSYTWYGLLGFALTIIVGILVSCATGLDRGNVVDSSLLFPFCRKFWGVEVDRQSMIETYQAALIPKKVSEMQHLPRQSTLLPPPYTSNDFA